LQGLLQDGAVRGLGGLPRTGGAALERLNETVIQAADDKLAPAILRLDIAGRWRRGWLLIKAGSA
jgi:hypothetical protein